MALTMQIAEVSLEAQQGPSRTISNLMGSAGSVLTRTLREALEGCLACSPSQAYLLALQGHMFIGRASATCCCLPMVLQ